MSDLAPGQTVRLSDGRTGIVRFVGGTHFASGDWVGVELEDDSGKNDGSVQGERYFDCDMGHGMFVRPTTLVITAQAPAAAPKPARRPSRPSSFNPGSGRTASDAGLVKRMSLNAPSPSPGPKTPRPPSTLRSPTKSPTKQLGSTTSSTAPSRTNTPSTTRTPTAGAKARPGVGPSRTSMGPPAMPASRATRQPSASSAPTRPTPGRPTSGRLSMTGRTTSARRPSADLAGDDDTMSPNKDGENSPVRARTKALEKLTSGSAATTPASSTKPATTARPTTNAAAANREIEDLKAKLKVLERKRLEDREKIKQLDQVQGERDRFQSIIEKLQAKYQPQQTENNELRKQLKEAEERFESIEAMQMEHETALELATLDREMAEETAEVLKVELEALKQKSEELELEVEILREENAEFEQGMSSEERASTGWLQMERTNERLREALLRLRDLTQQQEEELRDQIKTLEEDLKEFGTVKEQFATAKDKLAQSEAAVEDLRQQLDNALGAEDMIEELTERNMSMSEQIEELKAVIEDLENLKEINDELEINHVQNEKEMQEELDFKDSVITEQARRAAEQEEALEDMEYTLSRFRGLVTSLQSDLEDMRASHAVTETESEQLNSKSRAMMDLNMKLQISASKAQVKTIDLELRRLEAQEAEQHLEIVKMFLPDTYKEDQDSVLALLRFRRLAFKAQLLQSFIKDRVNGQPQSGHEDDIFAGCDAIDKLTWVASMCERFTNSISHCSIEQFQRFQNALFELEPVERALNGWIDGLRRDELKEQKCADELQRTIALMSHLAEVHLTNELPDFAEDTYMQTVIMQSHLESAGSTFATLRAMVQTVIPAESEEDEMAQHFSKKSEFVVNQTRSAKVIAGKAVRALQDLKSRSLALPQETKESFEQCQDATRQLAALAREIGFELHALLHEEGRTEPYTYREVQDTISKATTKVTMSSESDFFSTYLSKLRTLTSQISDLAALSVDLSQTQEFEVSPAPWKLRAQELKATKTIPVDAEEELRRLKEEHNEARRAIAQRDENLSTANLKIETLESRMKDANAKASRIEDLEAQIEAAKQKAASLQEDIDKQDRELKTLETDRDKWKKIAGDSKVFTDGAGAAGAKAGQERAVATAREMDALKSEIASLQAAVRYLREDNRRARTTEQHNYDWLAEPLTKPPSVVEQRRALVVAEGKDALSELVKFATSARVYDLAALPEDKLAWRPARSTPQYHAAKQREDLAAWTSWRDSVLKKSEVVLGRKDTAAEKRQMMKKSVAARLQIRLPDADGKTVPGGGRDVQIVGSREWEGMQGRLAAAI
ncbi:CAP-Gly domain-containing protein [Colletotrichum graminicola]|uniref:CAP-Gly domain-containing protein n=1 Tax=Colletotrichum graminicola (strain M1.001 / M2 / FGSC 10212) TaxID=645133 RepID=E3QR97_COLGM|nr:CAP-Gly domain-containing protein [Colletotrichum graminicola M1.001]EFQ33385.1 CAP-Gly domain-containing protein [Colletotrichum graminicola M1.001]WDK09621.1 CAP-Gly domain-containing protein [Colletotrichum graminicola]